MDNPITKRKWYLRNREDQIYQKSFRRTKPKIVYIKLCETCGILFKSSWDEQKACKPSHCVSSKKIRKQRKRAIEKYGQPISKKFKKELILIYQNKPTGMEVDHIIPLNGNNVSGLHVPWNLQYLTPEANNKKSNKI